MDLFLRFLILGGKYLSHLTAQSIVEAYRRSVQLGCTLNVHAQHSVAVVSHYDSVLEMYQRNLDEFQTLPNAHLAFISEQHRQEFESYMRDAGMMPEEDMILDMLKQTTVPATASSDGGETANVESIYVQQMTQSILGSCTKRPASLVTSLRTSRRGSIDNTPEEVSFEEPADMDLTAHENVKSFNYLTPRAAHAMNMFKEAEQDGVLNTVAEYLDRQADYIKCANDTFKQLQVDIANKYEQMQKQAVQQQEEDFERERIFAQKLKAVQQEVESCTKLMKKAQDHFDVNEEDMKTKRLFGSIDKIINDVEAITRLMKTNDEHFQKCEDNLKDRGCADADYTQVMDANLSAYNKFVCNLLHKQLRQYTNNSLRVYSTAATSSLVPIDCHILGFLNKRNKIGKNNEQEKILEVNKKQFEKVEKTIKFPLIGRWNNHLKKSRKNTNISRDKDRKPKKKRNSYSIKKSNYKFSNSRSGRKFTGQPLQRTSTDDLLRANFAALQSTWIQSDADISIGNQLMGPPESEQPKPFIKINHAITNFLRKQTKPDLSMIAKAPSPREHLLVVDEKLDLLVEQLLSNMNDVYKPNPTDMGQAKQLVDLYSANATDELKMKAFSEIKKEIANNVQNVRQQKFDDPREPVAYNLLPFNEYLSIDFGGQEADTEFTLPCITDDQVMFDGVPVELPANDFDAVDYDSVESMDFNKAMDDFTVKIGHMPMKHASQASVGSVQSFEANKSEAARRVASEETVMQLAVEEAQEARRLEFVHANEARAASIKAMQVASDKAYEDAVIAAKGAEEAEEGNRVLIEISQDVDSLAGFQMEAAPIEIEAFTPSPRALKVLQDDEMSRVCGMINFEPLEINIAYPDESRNESKISLHISVRPSVEKPENFDLPDISHVFEPQPPTLNHEINAKSLMADILSEMEEKNHMIQLQSNNMLLQLACEMNHAAAIKKQQKEEKSAAGKKLQQLIDLDEDSLEVDSEFLDIVSKLEIASVDRMPDDLSVDKCSDLTSNTLQCVDELVKQKMDNPKLATDVTSPRCGNLFRKNEAETKKRWNKFKSQKSRKTCKSYTVVKTKTNEVTLMDMINCGSRIFETSRDKLSGTRKLSFNKSSENVLKRLKLSKACTTLRTQSKDIKLIPMNLLQLNKEGKSKLPNLSEEIVDQLKSSENINSYNFNPYRSGSAKSFPKPAQMDITATELLEAEEKEVKPVRKPGTLDPEIVMKTVHKQRTSPNVGQRYTLQLEKIIEASSNKVVPKQQTNSNSKQVHLDKIVEKPEEVKITFVTEDPVLSQESPRDDMSPRVKVDPFDALCKIQAIRRLHEDSMKRSTNYSYLSSDLSQRGTYEPFSKKNAKETDTTAKEYSKNSHNASIDGNAIEDLKPSARLIQKEPQPPVQLAPKKQEQLAPKVNPVRKMKHEMPVIALQRFQSLTEDKSAPSSDELRERAKVRRAPENMQNLVMKTSTRDTLSVRSKSPESMKSINSKDTIASCQQETRAVQITPTYIIEEPIPKRVKWQGYRQSESGSQGQQSDNLSMQSKNVSGRHTPEPLGNICDYDIQYKHERPDTNVERSTHRPVDPLIKSSVESYHKTVNEECIKRGQMGGKFLIDYDPTVATAKAESFGKRGPQSVADDSYQDEQDILSISIDVLEDYDNSDNISDVDGTNKGRRTKPFQTRNQSSVSEIHMAPHTIYAKVRPRLDQLPKLEVIAEQIAVEKENAQSANQSGEPTGDMDAIGEKAGGSVLDVEGILSGEMPAVPAQARISLQPKQVRKEEIVAAPESVPAQDRISLQPKRVRKEVVAAPEIPEEVDDFAPRMTSPRQTERYMAPPDLNSLSVNTCKSEDGISIKVELLNPRSEEKVVYNFSSDPVSVTPIETETPKSSPKEITPETMNILSHTKVPQQAQISQVSLEKPLTGERLTAIKTKSKMSDSYPPEMGHLTPRAKQSLSLPPPTPMKLNVAKKTSKITYPIPQPRMKHKPGPKPKVEAKPGMESPKPSIEATKPSMEPRKNSPLTEAIRNSRVQFKPDTETLSFKQLNKMSFQKLAKSPQQSFLKASANQNITMNDKINRPVTPSLKEVEEAVNPSSMHISAVPNKEDPLPVSAPIVETPKMDTNKEPPKSGASSAINLKFLKKAVEPVVDAEVENIKVPKVVLKKVEKEKDVVEVRPNIQQLPTPRRCQSFDLSCAKPAAKPFADDSTFENFTQAESPRYNFPKRTPRMPIYSTSGRNEDKSPNREDQSSVKVEAPKPPVYTRPPRAIRAMKVSKPVTTVRKVQKAEIKPAEQTKVEKVKAMLDTKSVVPVVKSTSLTNIEPTISKPFVDMSTVASDMIRTGANIQYLNQLSSSITNNVYNELLEKCYPEEKQISDDQKINKNIIKMQSLLKQSQQLQVVDNQKKSLAKAASLQQQISPIQLKLKIPPAQQVSGKAEQPPQQTQQTQQRQQNQQPQEEKPQQPQQQKETFLVNPPANSNQRGMSVSSNPVIKTCSQAVINNLGRKSKNFERPQWQDSPRKMEVKSPIDKISAAQAKCDEQIPDFMKFKASERERNLKRLIILEEKIKKLEGKRVKKVETDLNGQTLVSVLEDMRCKKSSKFPEPSFRRIASTYKDNSAMGALYRKSYSNANYSKGDVSQRSWEMGRLKSPMSIDEDATEHEAVDIVPASQKVLVKSASAPVPKRSVAVQEQEEEEFEASGKYGEPMEEFISIPRVKRKQSRAKWASSSPNPPPSQIMPPAKIKPSQPEPNEEVPSAKGQWKLPLSRRKNLLPNIPELNNVELVVPKNVPNTTGQRVADNVSIDVPIEPPPFRVDAKYAGSSNLYAKDNKYIKYPSKSQESTDAAPPPTSPPVQAVPKVKPYTLNYQEHWAGEDPKTSTSQFDEKKAKSLKFFQNKVKQTIEAMQHHKEKEKEEKVKASFTFAKKSIHPYTNTFGRHLVRLRAESDSDQRQVCAEDYHKALAEKLQKMSSLPKLRRNIEEKAEPQKFVYRPPTERGGIRDAKKPSLSDVKRTILRHLKESTPHQKRVLVRSNATA